MNRQTGPTVEEAASFELLLDFLKRTRGFNVAGYKRSSLMRRIRKRMLTLGIDGFDEYLDYLEVHPGECASLFSTLSINVNGFFGDPPAWEYLATEIIPRILSSRRAEDFLRVWCAGASSGQEAYSIAMLLAQAMGEEQFRDRVKIYATDIDDEALDHSRRGVYSKKKVEAVPPALLDRFFERSGSHYVVREDLRRAITFGRHDLLQDAPISRIDLLVCRHTLTHFNAEAQTRILTHFSFGLRDNGFLFVGKSEMLLTHANLFTPVELKWRVFTRVPRTSASETQPLDVPVTPPTTDDETLLGASITSADVTRYQNLREELRRSKQELETVYEELQSTNEELQTTNDELNEVNTFLQSILTSNRVGVVVLDRDLRIEVWNRRAEDLLGPRSDDEIGQHPLNTDVGRPIGRLLQPLRAILSGNRDYDEVTLPVTNRQGKTIQLKITCAPLVGTNADAVRGVVLLMEEVILDGTTSPDHQP